MQLLEAFGGILTTAAALLLILTVLVAVHELGHFLFARMFGMEVNTFAVMMGGVRRTDLRPYLSQPLASGWWVTGATLASIAMIVGGGAAGLWQLEVAGFFLISIPLPYWMASRLEVLYHLPQGSAFKSMAQAWFGGFMILAIGTRFQGVSPSLFFGVLLGAAIVGVLLIYYRPVMQKSEDSPMGEGQIELSRTLSDEERAKLNKEVDDMTDRTLPVIFRPLFAWKDKRGTEFAFLLLPLGGFAAIKGMHAREDGSEVNIPGGFYSKPAWQRLIVLFAGPLFSILFGIILLFANFLYIGQPDLKKSTEVKSAAKDSPAEKAGIKPGDKVVSINGTEITGFFQMVSLVRDQFEQTPAGPKPLPTLVTISRDGVEQNLTILPKVTDQPEVVIDSEGMPTEEKRLQARIGLELKALMVPIPPGEAFVTAVAAPITMMRLIGDRLKTPETAGDVIGGPISMAQQSQSAVNEGWVGILQMAALLSIMLGIMNLLPIPPLDGGQMVIAFAEMLRRGNRLSLSLQHGLTMFGLLFTVGLTLLAVVMDVERQAKKARTQPAAAQPAGTQPATGEAKKEDPAKPTPAKPEPEKQ